MLYPITIEGRRGTTDDFAIFAFHIVLFSVALAELAKSIHVHPLKLSSYLFTYLAPLFIPRQSQGIKFCPCPSDLPSTNLSVHPSVRSHNLVTTERW